MKTISINLSDQAADRFSRMSQAEKEKFLSLFDEILEDKRTLQEVMDDMSKYAQKQGLSPEKLNDILNEDPE